MPADNGLSGLGLLMQLGGSLYLGLWASTVFMTLVTSGFRQGSGTMLLVGMLSMVRSALHRAAGGALLYPPDDDANLGSPLRATRLYIVASAIHTLAVLGLVNAWISASGTSLIALATALMAWPLTLALVLRAPRFRRFTQAIPMPEDRGFTGISIYMTLFGVTGTVFAACLLVVTVRTGAVALFTRAGMAMLVMGAVLLVRSIHHTRAGRAGLSGLPPAEFLGATTRYVNWGIGGAIVACCALGLLPSSLTPSSVLAIQALCFGYLLVTWPLLVRRFFAERGYSAFLRRGLEAFAPAPDRGLTALGWLLLAFGVLGMIDSLPATILGGDGLATGILGATTIGGDLAEMMGRSPWWMVLVSAAEVWAGLELIAMSHRHRLAATLFGVGGVAITLYVARPLIEAILSNDLMGGQIGAELLIAQLTLALAIPIATLVLVRHSHERLARARLVQPPGD